ncbi:MAG TPA: hypothetical protein VMJ64_18035 [Anaerolineales bacterium]|nr:hypothetical protein [Anaerolineales bacterium]
MDIRAGVIAMVILAIVFAFFSARSGLRAIQSARKMTFYRLRRQRETGGWRMLGLAALLALFAFALPTFGLPMAYMYFPPTPSITPTWTAVPYRTVTTTPTITPTATVTDTPLVTDTATVTSTPSLPLAVLALFQSDITPNPSAVFSPLTLSEKIDNNLQPLDPSTVFENPIGTIYATYSYDQMVPGAQWTAVWLRDSNRQQICLETHPFAGGTGGYDEAHCSNPVGGWQPGTYEVQIFVGEEWKVVGRFLVQGDVPTPLPTLTPTTTHTPTRTPAPTFTLTPAAPQTEPAATVTP